MTKWKDRLSEKKLHYEYTKDVNGENHKYIFTNAGLLGGDFITEGKSKKLVLECLRNEIDILTAMAELIEEFEHSILIEKDNE